LNAKPLDGTPLFLPARRRGSTSIQRLSRSCASLTSTYPSAPRNYSPASLPSKRIGVVTMGCGDQCPYIPGKRYLDWELPDPKGRPLAEVRTTRDDIARRVRALIDELNAPV